MRGETPNETDLKAGLFLLQVLQKTISQGKVQRFDR